jgi:acyl dehydratase
MPLSLERTLSQDDFDRFASLSGDDNPIHIDPAFSAQSRFGRPVAHGMLLYTVLAGALEHAYPGASILEQELMFPNPTYAGEAVTVEVAPSTDPAPIAGTAWLVTRLRKADGSLACDGQALLRLGEAR